MPFRLRSIENRSKRDVFITYFLIEFAVIYVLLGLLDLLLDANHQVQWLTNVVVAGIFAAIFAAFDLRYANKPLKSGKKTDSKDTNNEQK